MKGMIDTSVDNAATKLPAPCTPKLEYISAQNSGKAAPRRLRQTLRIERALEAYKVYESAKKSEKEMMSELFTYWGVCPSERKGLLKQVV